MLDHHKRFAGIALAIVTGLGAGGMAMGAHQDAKEGGPVRCEIETSSRNGMHLIEGLVDVDEPVAGAYEFKIKTSGRSGSSNTKQGGSFTAAPGEPTILGRVSMGSPGATFDIDLKLKISGQSIECSKRLEANA